MNESPSVVLLGVGNVLMADEGLGVHVVNELEKRFVFPENVRCVDGGTSTNELLGDLENLDQLIVIDAVRAGKPPGTMVRLEGSAVPSAFQTKLSPHQTGIADLLATLTFMGRGPKRIVFYGVEPERITLDLELSPSVSKVLPQVRDAVVNELAGLGISPLPKP